MNERWHYSPSVRWRVVTFHTVELSISIIPTNGIDIIVERRCPGTTATLHERTHQCPHIIVCIVTLNTSKKMIKKKWFSVRLMENQKSSSYLDAEVLSQRLINIFNSTSFALRIDGLFVNLLVRHMEKKSNIVLVEICFLLFALDWSSQTIKAPKFVCVTWLSCTVLCPVSMLSYVISRLTDHLHDWRWMVRVFFWVAVGATHQTPLPQTCTFVWKILKRQQAEPVFLSL